MSSLSQASSQIAPSAAMSAEMAMLNVTQAAAQKIHDLIQEEGDPHLKLRIYIMGGGCSGFQYGFSFETSIADDDHVFLSRLAGDDRVAQSVDANTLAIDSNAPAVVLLIDMMSFPYLKNAEIDYEDDVNGARFVVRNPNAKTTCGCGSSFAA